MLNIIVSTPFYVQFFICSVWIKCNQKFQSEISQIDNKMEDVINKIKTLKDQVKQVSEDQNQISDILRAIAEKQVKI